MRASRATGRVPDLLERWVADGLVTDDQARRMRADLVAAKADPRRTVAVAEALAYLGAALVVVALILVGSWYWADLGLPAKLGVAGGGAVALGVAGAVVPAGRSAVGGRLRAVLWLAATAATGGFLALAGDGAGWSEEVVAAVAAGGATVAAAACWVRHRHPVQHVAAFVSVQLLVTALVSMLPEPGTLPAVAIWVTGLAWGLLAWRGVLRPARLGRVLAAVALVLAAGGLAGETWGWPAAVATVGGLVWVAVLLRDLVMLVVASAGTLIVVPAIADRFFPGTLGVALALLVVGVLTVAAAIATLRRAPDAAPVRPSHDGAVPRRGEEER